MCIIICYFTLKYRPIVFLVRRNYGLYNCLRREIGAECMGLFPEVLSMLDGGSEDTNERSEPGIGFGFISPFSNEWNVLVN